MGYTPDYEKQRKDDWEKFRKEQDDRAKERRESEKKTNEDIQKRFEDRRKSEGELLASIGAFEQLTKTPDRKFDTPESGSRYSGGSGDSDYMVWIFIAIILLIMLFSL